MTDKEHDEIVEKCAALVQRTTHDGSELTPIANLLRQLKRNPETKTRGAGHGPSHRIVRP